VCPIYLSKDFRLVNPTNSNLKPQDKEAECIETLGRKKPSTFVSGKDRPLRSAALDSQQVKRPKNSDSDNGQVDSYKNFDSFFNIEHLVPKAFSPEPSLNDRIRLMQGPE
jgi:hypothetical protein